MFEELVVSGKSKPTHKRWSVGVAVLVQMGILGCLLLIPLLWLEQMPKTYLTTMLVAPAPPPPPPPPTTTVVVHQRPVIHITNKFVAPTIIPKKIAIVKDDPPASDGVTGGVEGGIPGGSPAGILNGITNGPPPPPPPPARIRVGGSVIAAKLNEESSFAGVSARGETSPYSRHGVTTRDHRQKWNDSGVDVHLGSATSHASRDGSRRAVDV